MLLPIVLLLASAGAVQQTDNVASGSQEQFSTARQVVSHPEPNGFIRGKPHHGFSGDEGMIVRHRPCRSDQECKTACLSITAYVFSDGENPKLKYVTDCPNLDVPYQNKRAQGKGMDNDHQPTLKRTN